MSASAPYVGGRMCVCTCMWVGEWAGACVYVCPCTGMCVRVDACRCLPFQRKSPRARGAADRCGQRQRSDYRSAPRRASLPGAGTAFPGMPPAPRASLQSPHLGPRRARGGALPARPARLLAPATAASQRGEGLAGASLIPQRFARGAGNGGWSLKRPWLGPWRSPAAVSASCSTCECRPAPGPCAGEGALLVTLRPLHGGGG